MREFNGALLIGGMRLRDVHGELEDEAPRDDSHDWRLAGRLRLTSEILDLIELNRQYRLQLEDGRAGQVFVWRIERPGEDQVLVEFHPNQLESTHSA
jgi:hypothetical protein